jgi:hypothetical protein
MRAVHLLFILHVITNKFNPHSRRVGSSEDGGWRNHLHHRDVTLWPFSVEGMAVVA